MYRKYIQELSATSASPDPDFPDTNLIVGEAHLKAARAGASHLDHRFPSTTTMAASPSSARLSDTRTALTNVSDPLPALPDGDSDTDSNSIPQSVRSESALSSVGRAAGRDAHSAEGVSLGRGRLKDSRRYSEIFRLQDILSRSNTPEFRRRPASHAHTHPAPRSSPPRVSEDDGFSTFSHEEVIVVRPVAEASRARSPLYPAPHRDLLLNHSGGPIPMHGVIRVRSAPKEDTCAEGAAGPQLTDSPEGEAPFSSRHLSNANRETWLRQAARPPPSPSQSTRRHSAGPSLYSVLCCRSFTSGR